jgi:predicted secreted protein
LAYRRLAGKVARDISDYTRSGHSVQAIVGVGGSPSCGVRTTLDLRGALETLAGCDPTQLNTDEFNRRVIVAHARPGQGIFIAALRRQLRLRGLRVPFDEHDLRNGILEVRTPLKEAQKPEAKHIAIAKQ